MLAACVLAAFALSVSGCSTATSQPTAIAPPSAVVVPKHKNLIFVWDGMRPDSINPVNTPTLYAMEQQKMYFNDNHSTYPTYTMANGAVFPLRPIVASATTRVNTVDMTRTGSGYSVSGYVRGADLLANAGFHAYDGNGCVNEPVLNGITAAGTPVNSTQVGTTGSVCGTVGVTYTTPAYRAPAVLLPDAIVMVTPGGSEMYFVPSHNPALVQRLVTFL